MCAVKRIFETKLFYPPMKDSVVLPGWNVLVSSDPRPKQEVFTGQIAKLYQCSNSFSCPFGYLELHRATGFLLQHRCSAWNRTTICHIRYFEFDQITASKLTVQGHIEQSQIARFTFQFKPYSDPQIWDIWVVFFGQWYGLCSTVTCSYSNLLQCGRFEYGCLLWAISGSSQPCRCILFE